MEKKKILFVCTQNSVRSQMAEGYLTSRYGDRFEAFSAGTIATSVHPCAISVMKDIGIDLSCHRSKKIDEFFGIEMDVLVTVCDNASGVCPTFPWAKKVDHVGFMDPSSAPGNENEIKEFFQMVRDEIIEYIDNEFGRD